MIVVEKLDDIFPTRSFPASLMNEALMPERPGEMMPLNTEPPGTAPMGCSFLKMMSSTVSPIPITLRMISFLFRDCKFSEKRAQCEEKAKVFCFHGRGAT